MRALAFGCVAIFRIVYGAKKESHQPEADDLAELAITLKCDPHNEAGKRTSRSVSDLKPIKMALRWE